MRVSERDWRGDGGGWVGGGGEEEECKRKGTNSAGDLVHTRHQLEGELPLLKATAMQAEVSSTIPFSVISPIYLSRVSRPLRLQHNLTSKRVGGLTAWYGKQASSSLFVSAESSRTDSRKHLIPRQRMTGV